MLFRRQNPQSKSAANQKSLNDYAHTVESILLSLNIDPKQAKLKTDDGFGWNFQWGSATIEVYVREHDGKGYFQVLSPIMHLPGSGLLQLYRRLLELNLQLTTASIGIYYDVVYIFSERMLEGLDSVEAQHTIGLVAAYADELDNQLVSEFGGRLFSQA
jgi:hypothetical protein